MHKLVILIQPLEDQSAFDETWPEFLHLAESMPDLRREATCRVERHLFGSTPFEMIHELYFDSLDAAQQAMATPQGRSAGKLLQQLTGGRMILFFADHKEDHLENILQHHR
jgi:uncharacterized protein (TIGR02118 family)